jgi:chorismate lyase/3-hydroxybenzoate synthase
MEQRLIAKARAVPRPQKPGDHRCRGSLIQHHPGTAQQLSLSDDSVLAEIRYGPEHRFDPADPRRIDVGTPPIGADGRELWHLPGGIADRGWCGNIGFAAGGGYLFAHILEHEAPDADLALVARRAYRQLLAFVRSSPCRQLLRIWNYVERINDHERGIERYQAFCKGRAEAFTEAGIHPRDFPAATAIGSRAAGLSVYLLASSRPGSPVENPRQLSAYRYPPPYGPRPPSFARAMCFRGPGSSRELAISGTASIVGHVTMHPWDLSRQVRETLRNLDLLADQARLSPRTRDDPPFLMKVYLRDPRRLAEVAPVLEAWAGQPAQMLFLQGDICRRELEIEIEAHCSMSPRPKARLRSAEQT